MLKLVRPGVWEVSCSRCPASALLRTQTRRRARVVASREGYWWRGLKWHCSDCMRDDRRTVKSRSAAHMTEAHRVIARRAAARRKGQPPADDHCKCGGLIHVSETEDSYRLRCRCPQRKSTSAKCLIEFCACKYMQEVTL